MITTEERIEALERQVAEWEHRLQRVEAPGPTRPKPAVALAPTSSLRGPALAAPPAVKLAPRPQRPPRPATRPNLTLEQLLGGRVLAWLGGCAVLAGLAFLFALGVSSGWLDQPRRCLIGALGAAGLVGAGAYLQERRARTIAGLAMVGAGLAGAFLAIAYATQAYDLIPTLAGAVLAAAVGTLGTVLALRWNAGTVGGIGLVGAALAPVLAGATGEPGAIVLLWLAGLAGVVVVVQRRWAWMAVALALVITPQWLAFLLGVGGTTPTLPVVVLVLAAFGVLGVLAAIGHELRVPRAGGVRPSSAFLLAGTALVLGLAGHPLIEDASGGAGAAIAWLAVLAAAHLAAGVAARRSPRMTDELALLVLTLGVVLADVALALALDGAPRALGWATSAVAFAWLAGRARGRLDPTAALAGLGLHVALAIVGVLGQLEPALSGDGALSATAGATLGAFAAAAFASARLASTWRQPLDALCLCALAALAALTLDGVVLTLTWAGEAVALGVICARTRELVAAGGAIAHLALAAGWCLIDQAPPAGLAGPADALGAATLGLGAIAVAAARLAVLARFAGRDEPAPGAAALSAVAAGVLLYAASLVAVALQPDSGGVSQGQLQLTALWALVGLGVLVAGLTRDLTGLRAAGLGLLGLAAAKLFAVDLSTLDAAWRVSACMAVGALLLLAAFVHARLRPESLPDLRESQTAFR